MKAMVSFQFHYNGCIYDLDEKEMNLFLLKQEELLCIFYCLIINKSKGE